MANTRLIFFYILFLVIFHYFAGELYLSRESQDFSLQNEIPLSDLRGDINRGINIINSNQDAGFFSKLINGGISFLSYIGLFILTILSYLAFIIKLIGTGVIVLPTIINLFMFVPLGIMITLDYILPYLRGQ